MYAKFKIINTNPQGGVYMARHISKQQLVNNILNDIQSGITRSNVDTAIPILNWTKEKIILAYQEHQRIQRFLASGKKTSKPRHVQRGHIYYAKLGKNIGSEQNEFRPVVVVQDGRGNATSNTVIVIPLTDALDKNGTPKRLLSTHVAITQPELKKPSIIKTEHIHNISKNRLQDEICCVDDIILKDVDSKLKICLGLN